VFVLGTLERPKLLSEKKSSKITSFALYWEALRERRKGTALLYFIAKHTPPGRLAKSSKSGHSSVGTSEELLIGTCLLRNAKLVNKKATKHFKEIQVPGYMNESAGARSRKAKSLAQCSALPKM